MVSFSLRRKLLTERASGSAKSAYEEKKEGGRKASHSTSCSFGKKNQNLWEGSNAFLTVVSAGPAGKGLSAKIATSCQKALLTRGRKAHCANGGQL